LKSIYIGLDIGTSGCKGIAIDEDFNTLAVNGIGYENSLLYKGLGKYDQPPQVLKEASLNCLKNLVEQLDSSTQVTTIGLTGQMHGLVALDRDLNPVRPIISCVDFRNEEQNQRIYEIVGDKSGLLKYTNNKMLPSSTAGKILWMMENEPELFKKVRVILNPKDYIRTVLTGIPGTDNSDASGYGLFDVKHGSWNKNLIDLIGIPEIILPGVSSSNQIVGCVLPEVANYLGVSSDVAVVAGGGDAVIQTIGAGAVSDGTYSVVLGTGGLISTSIKNYKKNTGSLVEFFSSGIDNQWVSYAGIMSVGASVDWLKNNYYGSEEKESYNHIYNVMESDALEAGAGSQGLIFYPSLLGQRNPINDPFAKGLLIGLTPRHVKGHVYRSLLEGIALGMKDVYNQLKLLGGSVDKIHISGGGASSNLWCQIFADVFQVDVIKVANYQHCGALGAAKLAVGANYEAKRLEELFRDVRIDKSFKPNVRKADLYNDLYKIYSRIYSASKPFFTDLKQFGEKHIME
jgi:xylulokinase